MKINIVLQYVIFFLIIFSISACSSEEGRPEGKGFFQQVLGLFSGKAHQEKEGWIVHQNGGDSNPKDVQEFLERARKAGLDLKSTDGEVQRRVLTAEERGPVNIDDNQKSAENFRDNESKMNARFEEMERLAKDGRLDEAMKKIASQGKLTVGGVDVPVKK